MTAPINWRQLAPFLALMILVALNLRPALSSMAPMLVRIQQDIGLSAMAIGALTTPPDAPSPVRRPDETIPV